MKHKNNKDERLNELFAAYIEEGEAPPESVTLKAKEALEEKQRAAEKVPELAAETAGGAHSSRSFRSVPRTVYIAIAAAVLIVAAVLIIILVPGGAAESFLGVPGSTALFDVENEDLVELDETDASDTDAAGFSDLFFFVEDGDAESYSEFALAAPVGGYGEGDVVLYRLECSVPPGVDAVVYVEAEGIQFDELVEYKDLPESRTVGGEDFRLGRNGGTTLVYFTLRGYGYNLSLATSAETQIAGVLEHISESFR